MEKIKRNPLEGKNITVGVTGSIAAYKSADLVSKLVQLGANVSVLMSKNAENFVGKNTFEALSHKPVMTNYFENFSEINIDHVYIAKNTDLIIVAPITANSIAKISHGITDDLITGTISASNSPVILAPAMDAGMYENNVSRNLKSLEKNRFHILEPQIGRLASGIIGKGRMVKPNFIIETATLLMSKNGDLSSKKIIISAGGTREFIDPVRYIGNRSSGKMGYAIATAARDRGADVSLFSAENISLPVPLGVKNHYVETSSDLEKIILNKAESSDIIIMAAAVCDFKPKNIETQKIKKNLKESNFNLELEKTSDIIKKLKNNNLTKIAFAAETENIIENAKIKLKNKNLDMIVANDVSRNDIGFNSDNNQVTLIQKDGSINELPIMPKTELAHILLDETISLIS
ncbi:MAG: bifunctional phosphopantothenoylcysteine decarboxylase/phosphopantothenate--cysteine ligase CoaBC [Chloroflexi bacterium]|nr:bifunctional phosphopantothenoylcysteine decarboxylase/phosphopantothenate--cysteine ligase CoaBC [Chloroflexota bacterium]|tara:strand:+ start:5061 stop:6275 length:1215 start_codon:yes stop_codon:yes gene_type:complete